jgi:hypothetical protein
MPLTDPTREDVLEFASKMNDRPPSREELVRRHNLHLLERRVDLTRINGDLSITRWGDILAGSLQHAGFARFILYWRYNWLSIQELLVAAYQAKIAVQQQKEELDRLAADRTSLMRTNPFDQAGHQALQIKYQQEDDVLGALAFRQETYAASLMLALSSLLGQLRDDIEANDTIWKECGPHYSGRSLGELVAAAANAYRHADEWLKTVKPSARQRISMDCLADALGRPMDRFGFRKSINCEILDVISVGSSETLTENVLGFAHSLALKAEQTASPR